MDTSLPESAFKHLEPFPGGRWTVAGEEADKFFVSYSNSSNVEIVTYALKPCKTEQDVITHCQSLLYNFETIKENERAELENITESNQKISQAASQTAPFKIEPIDNTFTTKPKTPSSLEDTMYEQQPNENFSFSPQESFFVPPALPDNAFNMMPSLDFQQQLPPMANTSFVPSNAYWSMQPQFDDNQGSSSFANFCLGTVDDQWYQ